MAVTWGTFLSFIIVSTVTDRSEHGQTEEVHHCSAGLGLCREIKEYDKKVKTTKQRKKQNLLIKLAPGLFTF